MTFKVKYTVEGEFNLDDADLDIEDIENKTPEELLAEAKETVKDNPEWIDDHIAEGNGKIVSYTVEAV